MPEVRFSYLREQFAEPTLIAEDLARLAKTGDFTLGKAVGDFERRFAELIGTKHAIGVGSGTDALKLSLRALGVGHGDEVITAANTFIATVGAIAETGATPVLVDCDDTFCMDVNHLETAISPKTKALMPVHFTGCMVNMPRVMEIAEKKGLPVVEDACQAILAEWDGKCAGTWGKAGGFSLHPLKNLNVWGDAGVIVTNDDAVDKQLRLIRNHGLADRDTIVVLGHNSRLDSVQAVVGNHLIGETPEVTRRRIANAAYYDEGLKDIPGIRIPPRPSEVRWVYHLYMVFAEDRDALDAHCNGRGVKTKVHYPIPLYQQEGLKHLGYQPGDFPVSDRHAASVISLPVDQYITRDQQDHAIATVREFYES